MHLQLFHLFLQVTRFIPSCSELNIRYYIELKESNKNESNMSLLNASVTTGNCLQRLCSLNFSFDSRQSNNVPYEVIITIIELRKKLSLRVGK